MSRGRISTRAGASKRRPFPRGFASPSAVAPSDQNNPARLGVITKSTVWPRSR